MAILVQKYTCKCYSISHFIEVNFMFYRCIYYNSNLSSGIKFGIFTFVNALLFYNCYYERGCEGGREKKRGAGLALVVFPYKSLRFSGRWLGKKANKGFSGGLLEVNVLSGNGLDRFREKCFRKILENGALKRGSVSE